MTDPRPVGEPMIRLDELTKRYPGQTTPAVDAISLDVPAGEVVVFVGPSGCGKTTTLKMINRIIEPTSGRIVLDGEDVTDVDPDRLRRRIGYVASPPSPTSAPCSTRADAPPPAAPDRSGPHHRSIGQGARSVVIVTGEGWSLIVAGALAALMTFLSPANVAARQAHSGRSVAEHAERYQRAQATEHDPTTRS